MRAAGRAHILSKKETQLNTSSDDAPLRASRWRPCRGVGLRHVLLERRPDRTMRPGQRPVWCASRRRAPALTEAQTLQRSACRSAGRSARRCRCCFYACGCPTSFAARLKHRVTHGRTAGPPQDPNSRPKFHVKDLTCDENDPNFPFYDEVHGMYHLMCVCRPPFTRWPWMQ
jgi:hypothetical protein